MGKVPPPLCQGSTAVLVVHKGNSLFHVSGGLKFSGWAFLQHSDLSGSWYYSHPNDEGVFQYLAEICLFCFLVFWVFSPDRINFPVLQWHKMGRVLIYAKTASIATPAHLLRGITNLTQTFTWRSHTVFNQAMHPHPAGAICSTFIVMIWRRNDTKHSLIVS